jgi:hypothetical protein
MHQPLGRERLGSDIASAKAGQVVSSREPTSVAARAGTCYVALLLSVTHGER